MATQLNSIETLANQEYKWGFITNIEADSLPAGLNEDVIGLISARKNEPQFMLDWRLKAYRHWLTMKEPTWANVHYPTIDYQKIIYYSAPKTNKDGPKSLDEVDPELLKTYEKLGIPLRERELLAGVAVDAVFDSVSVATTFKEKLSELGIIFCSFSEAVQEHPELVQKYLGTVVPSLGQFFRGAERGRVQRWLILLHPQRGSLPDGAVHLFPYQCEEHRPVRAHAHHCRGRSIRQLSRRLHCADARHESIARRGSGIGRAR